MRKVVTLYRWRTGSRFNVKSQMNNYRADGKYSLSLSMKPVCLLHCDSLLSYLRWIFIMHSNNSHNALWQKSRPLPRDPIGLYFGKTVSGERQINVSSYLNCAMSCTCDVFPTWKITFQDNKSRKSSLVVTQVKYGSEKVIDQWESHQKYTYVKEFASWVELWAVLYTGPALQGWSPTRRPLTRNL